MASDSSPLTLSWYGSPSTLGSPAIATGVFDILHVGHARFLTAVRARGYPLMVGIEDDPRVRAWKGDTRPVNPAADRAELLATLRPVDAVFIISGDPEAASWEDYVALLEPLRPAALAYTAGDPYSAEKQRGAAAMDAAAWELPLTENRSSTAVLGRRLG